jgi:hypothetical protein
MSSDRDIDGKPATDSRSGRSERLGIFQRAWRGTKWATGSLFRAFPADQIVKNGRLIEDLVVAARRGPAAGRRLWIDQDRSINLSETAYAYGVSVEELEAVLNHRRRMTARAAYLSFGLGWMFFGLWLLRAVTMPWTSSQIVAALEFVPFCLIFFLMAFKRALQNYQIRTRCLATAWEYLQTAQGFWPN